MPENLGLLTYRWMPHKLHRISIKTYTLCSLHVYTTICQIFLVFVRATYNKRSEDWMKTEWGNNIIIFGILDKTSINKIPRSFIKKKLKY